jgi:prevent-host-death family protein
MKTVNAREANQAFSALLSQVEHGDEIVITKHGRPVAVLGPYRRTLMTPERRKAIRHAMKVMAQGLPWGSALRSFNRDEMHDR